MKRLLIALAVLLPNSTVFAVYTDVGRMYLGAVSGGLEPQTTPSLTLNASGEDIAFVFVVPKSGTIEAIGVRLGTVTEADNNAVNVTIETVANTGLPSGTDYGGSSAGTITQTSDTTQEANIGDATAVAGDLVAVYIEFSSYTDGNINIVAGGASGVNHVPRTYHDTGAGLAEVANNPMLYLKYSGSEYIIPGTCWPPSTASTTSIQSDTTPDEIGFQYTAPVGMRLVGLNFDNREFGSTANVTFNVFSNAATPLSLLTVPTVMTHDALNGTQRFANVGLEPEELAEGQVVTVGIFSADATNNLQITYLDVADAAHWGNFMPGIVWATRTRTTDGTPNDGPAFTPVTTRKPLGGLYFDQIDTGATNVVDPLTGTIPGL